MTVADELYIALLSFWVLISVASNISVTACIWKTSKDRKTDGRRSVLTTDILLVSLALNDILLAGIVLPQKIHSISHTHDFFERKSFEVLSLFPTACIFFTYRLFSERDTYVHVRYMLSAVRLSSVCDVGAPYSGG